MNSFMIHGLYLLAGIVVYASGQHFAYALSIALNRVQFLFAGLCFIAALYTIFYAQSLQATSTIEFVNALKWNIAAALLFFILFSWFVALYSGKVPRLFITGLSVLFALLFVVNFMQPYSLQYESIDGLHSLRLPWGEVVTDVDGYNGPWMYIAITLVLISYSYALYALGSMYIRSRRSTDLWMLLSMGLFFLGGTESILVRLSIISFIGVCQFSLIAMVLVMGAALASEMRKRLRESEIRFRTVIEQSPIAMAFGRDGCTTDVNSVYLQMFGYDNIAEVRGKPLTNEIAPQCRPEIEDRIRRRARGETVEATYETIGMRKDGSQFPLFISAKRVVLSDGPLTYAFLIDFTERKQFQEHLKESANRFRLLFESANDGLILLSMDGRIVDINKRGHDRLGYAKEEMLGRRIAEFNLPEYADQVPERVANILRDGESIFESVHMRKDGSRMPVEINAKVVELDGKNIIYSIIRDITERKAAEDRIQLLAFYDPLTELPNRRLLVDRLQQALVSSARSGRQGALLFIDLDNFKNLNDTLGHDIGDMLLQQVTHRLGSCIREGDTMARLGGDEFVVMLLDLSEQPLEAAAQSEAIGEKILAALSQPYQLDKHAYRCTGSLGVTLFSGNQQLTEELMKQADIAMYQAKKAGRNALRFFDREMQENISARVSLESELHNALEFQQFHLHYQVQVDGSHRPFGAEALIRWIHPVRGQVSPAQFIPLAEETGMILPIGLWVLERACAQLKAWQQDARTRDLVLAINVSAKQFHQTDFVTQVEAAIQRYAISPRLLKLELTEGMLLENIEFVIATMGKLNEIGVRFSLDDFGTGYSSLQYLKRLPLDQLKIDQSFVRDIETDSSDKAIVSTIIAMAQILNLDVIAEGVETEEQRRFLMNSGCVNFQGHLFGRPLPIDQFEVLLKHG